MKGENKLLDPVASFILTSITVRLLNSYFLEILRMRVLGFCRLSSENEESGVFA